VAIWSAAFATRKKCTLIYSSTPLVTYIFTTRAKQLTLFPISVKAILDANRNSLMLLDLKFTIGTLAFAAGTFIAALYGMNLKNFIEESDLGFPLVSLSCSVFTAVALAYGLRKLRKVQRVSMWGEGSARDRGGGGGGVVSGGNGSHGGADAARRSIAQGRSGRGSWREIEPEAQLAGMSRTDRSIKWKLDQSRQKSLTDAAGGGGGASAKG